MTFTIQVSDHAVMAALGRVRDAAEDMSPIMQRIGESVMERIKQRFGTASGPDGTPWAPNSPVTLARYIQTRGGKNRRTQALASGKKPLQGITGDLAREFHVSATNDSVTIGSTMKYAAMQQFGGKRSEFLNLWGDIPARPFFPVSASGELYPEEGDMIVAELQQYIQGAAEGQNSP